MRTAAAAVLQAALCTALRAPVRQRTVLKASTQPFVYDNADTLADRYAEYERVCQAACDDDDAFSDAADAELEQLNAAFKIDIKPAHFFLGNNITIHGAAQVGAP